jgi:hypothetical protein
VTVYTIRLVSGNAGLLRDCASEEKKYFDVKDAGQLGPVFQAIAREISSTRRDHVTGGGRPAAGSPKLSGPQRPEFEEPPNRKETLFG